MIDVAPEPEQGRSEIAGRRRALHAEASQARSQKTTAGNQHLALR